MAQIIVNFRSEQEAREVMARLEQAELGEVRMRVLDGSRGMGHPKTDATSPMITSELGSVEVRSTETPEIPESEHNSAGTDDADISASIPTTGTSPAGMQVLVEVDDAFEAETRRILGIPGG